jgi:hypothetical protein
MSDNYLGNPLLKNTNVKVNYTAEQLQEYVKCAEDPVYFMETYIKVVNLDQGLVPFQLYPFQRRIVETVHNNRFTICKIPRQSGKSITVTSYLLHYCLFNANVRVAILANKGTTAKELLDRFKTSYENLPRWLQQGVVEWNKFSVQLENGSKIISAATSSSAVRGGSYNVIVLDEYAYVPNGVAEEFFSSVYPTISSGKNTKAILISTPKGLNHFYKTWTNAQNGKNGYVPIEAKWYDVPGRDDKFKQQTIANTSEAQWRTEFECDFVGSENTLIAPSKIANMIFGVPQTSTPEGLDIYEPPQKNHIYAMCIDTSRGEEQDYHAMSIIDCTKMPYRQVAKFKNNTISYQVIPHHIKKLGDMYNEALALFEINDLGQAVAEILHEELEYGNILSVSNRGKRGQKADGGFGSGKVQMGVRMSYQIKKMGCSLLKDMVENDKLIIQDFDTISEFSTFVARGAGYEANEGYNDDLVSTLVLFGWLTTQSYFKDYTNSDVRQRIYEEQIRKIEEQVMPFGFFNDGVGADDDNIDIFDDRNEKQRRADDMELWKD